jgi:hypothetical protein
MALWSYLLLSEHSEIGALATLAMYDGDSLLSVQATGQLYAAFSVTNHEPPASTTVHTHPQRLGDIAPNLKQWSEREE